MKNEALFRVFKNMKGKWTLLLLLGAGLLLLLVGGTGGEVSATGTDSEAYRAALTEEVERLCSEVEGVGALRVLLTLEAGEHSVFAEKDGGYITSGGKGLLVEVRPPRVAGVAVVCAGGGDPAVREALTELLSAALGIGSHKIKIAAKK